MEGNVINIVKIFREFDIMVTFVKCAKTKIKFSFQISSMLTMIGLINRPDC